MRPDPSRAVLQRLGDRLPEWSALPAGRLGAAGAARGLAKLAELTGAAMLAWSATASWPANDRSGSDFTARHAEIADGEAGPPERPASRPHVGNVPGIRDDG